MGEPRADDRLDVLDLMRGVAVLGILPANMPMHSDFMDGGPFSPPTMPESLSDRLLHALTLLFIDGKMISTLAILFGVGLMIQVARATEAGRPYRLNYLWRQFLLLLIGGFHALFIWYGDILVTYAVIGMGMVFLAHLKPRTKYILIGIFLTVFYLALIAFGIMQLLATPGETTPPSSEIEKWFNDFFKRDNQIRIYTTPSAFGELLLTRLVMCSMFYAFEIIGFGWGIAAMFLLGTILYQQGFFTDLHGHERTRSVLRGTGVFGFLVTLTGAGLYLAKVTDGLGEIFVMIGALALALGYITLYRDWAASGRWPRLQAAFRAVGRTALTYYLLQSVICMVIFTGFGFGLFGKLTRTQTWPIILAIWAFSLLTAPVYLRYFQMGPVEWLWRSAIVGRWLPLARVHSKVSVPVNAA